MIPVTVYDFSEEFVSKFSVYIIQIPPILLVETEKSNKASSEEILKHREKILSYLSKIPFDFTEKLIVFPELSMNPDLIPYLEQLSSTNNAFIIAGSFYKGKRNVSRIITPFLGTFSQDKLVKSKYEPVEISSDKNIKIFKNTKIGSFAVIICRDYVETSIIAQISGRIDFIVILAVNRATKSYQLLSKGDSFRQGIYVIHVNSTKPDGVDDPAELYGGSCIYGPYRNQPVVIKGDFRERMLTGEILLRNLKMKNDPSFLGTVKENIMKTISGLITIYPRSKLILKGLDRGFRNIKKCILNDEYKIAFDLSTKFGSKFELEKPEMSISFYTIAATIGICLKDIGGSLAIIDKIIELERKYQLQKIDNSILKDLLNSKLKNEFQTVLRYKYG